MKKFLMTLVAAFAVAMSANAQVYVGGGFGINGVDNGNTTVTTYKFIPEVGYNFNENWAAGVAFGWEGGCGYKHTYTNRNDADLWAVGARPGVAVNLTKKLSFVSHVGFLGWSQSKDNNSNLKTSRYGLDLDGNDITFSLYYNF